MLVVHATLIPVSTGGGPAVTWDVPAFVATYHVPWPNTQLVNRDAVGAVRELKETGTTTPMRTIGSLTLCRSLLNGLVDRFRVVVFPVITGSSGRDRIYDGYRDVSLDMIGSHTFDGRLQLVEYKPKVLASPPGSGQAGI